MPRQKEKWLAYKCWMKNYQIWPIHLIKNKNNTPSQMLSQTPTQPGASLFTLHICHLRRQIVCYFSYICKIAFFQVGFVSNSDPNVIDKLGGTKQHLINKQNNFSITITGKLFSHVAVLKAFWPIIVNFCVHLNIR